jgi:hypothetical protein
MDYILIDRSGIFTKSFGNTRFFLGIVVYILIVMEFLRPFRGF